MKVNCVLLWFNPVEINNDIDLFSQVKDEESEDPEGQDTSSQSEMKVK